MSEIYRFATFISYASQDADFAKELHKKLEKYKIPKSLGSFDLIGGGKENRVYPVFRDREELPAGDLNTALEAALKASFSLIVICSPNSANSRWVMKEIEFFESLGRGDKIFYIIPPNAPIKDGEADGTHLNFPPQLLRKGEIPLAADARPGKDTKRYSILKIIAGLIEVRPGDLADRDKARRRRNHIVALISGTLLACFSIFILWGYFLPHTTYAKNYVRKHGIWQPVDIVSASDSKKRQHTYVFSKSGALGHISQVKVVNNKNYCPLDSTNFIRSITHDNLSFDCTSIRPCSVGFGYKDGTLASEIIYDQAGNVIEDVRYRDLSNQAIRQEAVLGCSRSDNGIKYVEIERDPKGRDLSIQFFRAPSIPGPNKSFANGYRYNYDNEDRKIGQTALDKNGQATVTKSGVTSWAWQHDANGAITRESYFDKMDNLVSSSSGIAEIVYEDIGDNGVASRGHYLDENGEFATTEKGYHRWEKSFGESGQTLTFQALDADLNPVNHKNGYSSVVYDYNQYGFTQSWQYFGVDGLPIQRNNGCAIDQTRVNEMGTTIENRCYSAKNIPANDNLKKHRFVSRYDNRFNRIESRAYDTDGNPVFHTDVAHRVSYLWNDQNQKIGTAYYGVNDEPIISPQDGYFRLENTFNENGYISENRTYDIEGNLIPDKWGAVLEKFEYNERGQKIKSQEFDSDLKIPIDRGSQNYTTEYDDLGLAVKKSYIDEKGQPTELRNGVAQMQTKYDERGNVIRYTYYNLEGKLTAGPDGTPIVEMSRDIFGRLSQYRFLNSDGELTTSSYGYAAQTQRYDTRGNVIEYRYLSPDEKLVARRDGVAVTRYTYNSQSKITSIRYYDPDENPTLDLGTNTHGIDYLYNARGDRIKEISVGLNDVIQASKNNHAIAIFEYEFDSFGRQTQRRFYGSDGNPSANNGGEYGFKMEYDQAHRRTKVISLGSDFQRSMKSDMNVETRFEYNDINKIIASYYYGSDGKPVAGKAARLEREYDSHGREIERRYLDQNGALIVGPYGDYAKIISVYNKYDKLATRAFFGSDDKPFDNPQTGWSRRERVFDENGRQTEETCWLASAEKTKC